MGDITMFSKKLFLSVASLALFVSPAVMAQEADVGAQANLCQVGKAQSPVSIDKYAPSELPPLQMDYKDAPLDMVNNGDTVQMYYEKGSSLSVGDMPYRLWQIEFYTPSEHYMNGAPYPMEMQFVHQAEDKSLAIVSVFVKLGEHNKYLQGMWDNVPEQGRRNKIPEVSLSAKDIMPEDMSYYSYDGSLTRSPCMEDVKWFILKTPIEMSAKQLSKFERMFPRNARPIQPLNGRVVRGSK